MKSKLIILSLLLLMLLPMVAAWELNPFADIKTVEKSLSQDTSPFLVDKFNPEYGTIRLSKTAFWFETDKIAEYSLTSNTKYCAGGCEQIIQTTLYEDMPLMDKVDYTNIEGTNYNPNLGVYLLKGQEEYTVTVPDKTKTTCKTDEGANREICPTEVLSYKEETRVRDIWERYNGEVLKAGNYTYKITGSVKAGQTVDVIQTSDGKEFNEWAWWVGVQPSAYWKLNEASGNITDSSGNGFNLTNEGTTDFVSAKLYNGANFTAADSSDRFTNKTPVNASFARFGTNNFTIAFWVKAHSQANSGLIGTENTWLSASNWRILIYGHKAYFGQAAGGTDMTSSATIDDGNWHRIVYVREGTGASQFKLYIDGSSDTTGTQAGNFSVIQAIWIGGGDPATYKGFQGTLDDIQIFNGFAWSSTDVTSDYNGGAGKEADTSSYSVTAVNSIPLNNTNQTSSTVNFGCNLTATGTNITSVILNVSGSVNWTQSVTGLNTDNYNATFTNSTLADSTYNWFCTGIGVAANGTSTSWRFYKDSNAPTMNYGSQTEADGSTISRANIVINVTSTDTNFKNITISLYNSTMNLINSTNSTVSPLFVNFTSPLVNGTYYFNASSWDTFGNRQDLATRTVTIQTGAASINVVPSIPLSGFVSNSSTVNFACNTTGSLTNITSIFLNVNDTNSYALATSNTNYPSIANNDSSIGTIAWRNPIYVTSSDNNRADTAATIATNAITRYIKAQDFNLSIPSDAVVTGITVSVEKAAANANRIVTHSIRIVKGGVITGDNKNSLVTWTATDSNESFGSSTDLWGTTWTASDINDPSFGVVIAANNTGAATTPRIDSIVINVSYMSNKSITGLNTNNYNATFTLTNFSDGNYNWNCTAFGTFGNGSSINRPFTVDTTAPSVSITYPVNGIDYNADTWTGEFNFDASDSNIDSCWYSTDGGTTNNSVNCGTDLTGITPAGQVNVLNTWIIAANDTAGNKAMQSVGFYAITSPASFTPLFPNNNSAINTNRSNFTVKLTMPNAISLYRTVKINMNGVNVTLDGNSSVSSTERNYTTEKTAEHLVETVVPLQEGTNHYYYTYEDTFGNYNSSSTYSLIVDTLAPNITITSPINVNYLITGGNLTLNYTVSGLNVSTCWYTYNSSTKTYVGCYTNTSSFQVTNHADRTITFYSNKTNGLEGNRVNTWEYYDFEYSNGVAANVLSGASTLFTYNFSSQKSPIVANLIYNGTSYAASINNLGSYLYTLTRTIDVPISNSPSTKNVYWNLLFADGTYVNSTVAQQTISGVQLAACSGAINFTVLNISAKDETTGTSIPFVLSSVINYWSSNSSLSSNSLNYSFGNTSENSYYALCVNPSTAYFNMTATIAYSKVGYTPRSYYFTNAMIGGYSQNLTLYLLNNTLPTAVTFTVGDQSNNVLSGAFINIQRWDLVTNTYSLIDVLETDVDGKAVADLQLNSVWYRYQVYYNGILYLVTNPSLETSTTRTLTINTQQVTPYLQFGNVFGNVSFNNNTNTFTFTFADTTGSVNQGCLQLTKVSAASTEEVSNYCTSASSGTIIYTVSQNGTYVADGIVTLSPVYQSVSQVIDSLSVRIGGSIAAAITGHYGFIILLILLITIGAVAASANNIVLGSVGMVVALIFGGFMGWITLSGMSIPISLVIIFIFIGIISFRRNF